MTPSHQHYAVEDTARSPQEQWLPQLLSGSYKLPGLEGKKGVIFSNTTLEKYIQEEERHDNFKLTSGLNRSLRTLSSGEQKKALLSYLLQQNPDFIVLNNPYETLDKGSVVLLKQQLIALSKDRPIVLIFNRQDDLLPIITHAITFEKAELKVVVPIEDYAFRKKEFVFDKDIPSAITTYNNIPEVLIELKNVNVNYEDRSILKDINWTIKKKEFWHLIGPNGSGKTTLLSMIYGNNSKAYGQEVCLFGKKKGSGESVWDIKQKIGYISPAMLELFKRSYTVEHMVISGFYDSIGLYQTPSTAQILAAAQWMDVLNLSQERNTSFLKLSPAVQRLILIARAMIKHPPLLILDEPLINVDDEGRALISALINKIAKESETSILFVAHRDEANIHPNFIYELHPSPDGSVGVQK
ncbi:putative molybdenum transport ATP-binding protein modF [Winogradskyella psychrotolerans RS-3]|uniref:Putative molybdenum transport ATP-binding protein modF n=1 Tax=Winogradskyella psychrotolerans RS-3 TaxID=641526 RepID=S7WYN0_9FLAO|nr:ATP-binding cassette domain-containing protein [Winogradskyella psychrotolerans]EPR71899.1 putative molybdenum transport ATP-binding protein modF [Winogradskyella psychrotolerans RS-3]